MATIRIYQTIDKDIFQLRLVNDPEALSQSDNDLMRKFGEPEINLGGTFLSGGANEFTLPDEYAKIRSDFPVVRRFDSRSAPFDTSTVTKVEGYRDEILSRLDDAFETLRASSDTFTKEDIHEI